MKKIKLTLAFLLITATTSTALASSLGEDEYLSAEKIRIELEPAIEQLANHYPGPTDATTINAKELIKKYYNLLAESTKKGFPPALYRTAQILGNEPSTMYTKKTEICNLLSRAAAENLLSAKHANFFFCSPNKILFNLGAGEASNAMKPLVHALNQEDPYRKFYPLPTIKNPICPMGSAQSPPNSSNPFTLITSTAKPLLKYEEYIADLHLLLYINEHELHQASAEQHKEKAKSLNCAAVNLFPN